MNNHSAGWPACMAPLLGGLYPPLPPVFIPPLLGLAPLRAATAAACASAASSAAPSSASSAASSAGLGSADASPGAKSSCLSSPGPTGPLRADDAAKENLLNQREQQQQNNNKAQMFLIERLLQLSAALPGAKSVASPEGGGSLASPSPPSPLIPPVGHQLKLLTGPVDQQLVSENIIREHRKSLSPFMHF